MYSMSQRSMSITPKFIALWLLIQQQNQRLNYNAFGKCKISTRKDHWRRINMRKVAHLAGAESLHNLYNRHWPRINSIRFRHTITNYKDGTVESFAPSTEWQYLQHWLSKNL